jgi:hypothetical protein
MRNYLWIIALSICVLASCSSRTIVPSSETAVLQTPSAEVTAIPTSEFLGLPDELQPITRMNVEQVQMLEVLKISGYTRGAISQCNPAFSPDGRFLAGACGRNPVPVWDVQAGRLVYTL